MLNTTTTEAKMTETNTPPTGTARCLVCERGGFQDQGNGAPSRHGYTLWNHGNREDCIGSGWRPEHQLATAVWVYESRIGASLADAERADHDALDPAKPYAKRNALSHRRNAEGYAREAKRLRDKAARLGMGLDRSWVHKSMITGTKTRKWKGQIRTRNIWSTIPDPQTDKGTEVNIAQGRLEREKQIARWAEEDARRELGA